MAYMHSATDKVIKVLNATNRKDKNVWLYGECGTGKSEMVQNIADKMGLDFYTMSLSAQTTVFKLTGFLDANSNYKPTPLRQAYENGGLICLEECDTVNSGILAEINNILSQNIYSFPDKTVKKHKDFKLICCANSNGKNNDIKYTKSQQMDTSTLDRFVFIKIDFEEKLAESLTNNKDWFKRVMKFRQVAKEVCGDDLVIGMRAMIDGADLLEAGFSQAEVEDMVIYKGIDQDIIDSIKAKMNVQESGISNTFNEKKKEKINTDFELNSDGLYTLSQNGEECVWFDAEFCKQDDFKLLSDIKKELGL